MKRVLKRFTLLELMGAVLLATFIISILIKTFGTSTDLMSRKLQSIESYSDLRLAMNMLTSELESMHYSGEEVFSNEEIKFYTFTVPSTPKMRQSGAPVEVSYKLSESGELSKELRHFTAESVGYEENFDEDLSGEIIENVKTFSVTPFKETSGSYTAWTSGDSEKIAFFIIEMILEPNSQNANRNRKITRTVFPKSSENAGLYL